MRSLDAELLAATCDSEIGYCQSAVQIDGQCLAHVTAIDGSQSWSEYDCALGGEGILEQAAAAAAAPSPWTSVPVTTSPYANGSDGFVRLAVRRSFTSSANVAAITNHAAEFGVDAQFFETIDGTETVEAEVLDPLEGTDDCGVVRYGDQGTGIDIRWRQVGAATLIDNGDEIPLEEFMSGELFTYGARLGRGPRYGERYGIHVEGGPFGPAFDSDRVVLPQALSVETFEQGPSLLRGDLTLHWSGSGSELLHIGMGVMPRLSDLGGNVGIQCLVEDDGEFTIPSAVLKMAPDGIAGVNVTRRNRGLQFDGGHTILVDAEIVNSYRFAFGAACYDSAAMAACADYAQAAQQAYADCNQPVPSMDELCPANLVASCAACPEYYACKAEQTRCENGDVSVGSCACD